MGEAFITRRGGKPAKKQELIGTVNNSGSLSLPYPIEDYSSFRVIISGSISQTSEQPIGSIITTMSFGDQEIRTYSTTTPGDTTVTVNQTTDVVMGSTPDGIYAISTANRPSIGNQDNNYQKLLSASIAASKTIGIGCSASGSENITQTVYGYR